MLLSPLFHEYPQTDPVVPKSSPGTGFPVFLNTGDQEEPELIPGPRGLTGDTGIQGPINFLNEIDLPEDLPLFPPGKTPGRTFPFFLAAGTSNPISLLDGPALLFFVAAGTANNIGITS